MSGEYRKPLAALGLDAEAGWDEVKLAYRRLSKRYHPDSSGDPSTASRFQKVVRAYRYLEPRMKLPPPVQEPGALGAAQARARSREPKPGSELRRVIEAGDDLFALGELLARDPDPRVRAGAARRIGLAGKRSAYVLLRKGFYDPDHTVVMATVHAAAFLGIRQAGAEIAALFGGLDKDRKLALVEIAARTAEPLFTELLALAVADPEPTVRIAARAAMEALRGGPAR